jgi:hypothetical protein
VTHCVVHQIANQDGHPGCVPQHRGRFGGLEFDLHGLVQCPARQLGNDFPGDRTQIQRHEIHRPRRIDPGQRQQLLHQVRHPVASPDKVAQGMLPAGVIGGGQSHLGLRFQAGQRGPQFMGGVGGKAAFLLEASRYSVEQAVDPFHKGQHFGRQVVDGQRGELVGRTLLDLGGHPLHRADPLAHRQPDQDGEERQSHQQGTEEAGGDGAGQLIPGGHAFSHLHHGLTTLAPGGKDPPALALDRAVGQAVLGDAQWLGRGVGGMEPQSVVDPYLEGDPATVSVQVRSVGLLDHLILVSMLVLEISTCLGDQQGGSLDQVGVEQFLRLMPGLQPSGGNGKEPKQAHQETGQDGDACLEGRKTHAGISLSGPDSQPRGCCG